MKQTSTARAIAAAVFLTSLAGCSSSWEAQEEAASSSMGGGGLQGMTASGGGNSVDCYQYSQMTSESTPSDEVALLEQNMRRMTPAMRDRHMSEMRKMCAGVAQDANR